jgi:hypothetical protein
MGAPFRATPTAHPGVSREFHLEKIESTRVAELDWAPSGAARNTARMRRIGMGESLSPKLGLRYILVILAHPGAE